MRSLWAVVLIAMLSGCAPKVQSNVSAFSTMSSQDSVKPIIVLPIKEEDLTSLEWQTYASKVESELAEKRFVTTKNFEDAKLVAFFGAGIDSGRDVQSTYSIPTWGVVGTSSSTTYGNLSMYGNTGTYTGTTYHMPQYGITGYQTGVRTDRVFSRAVVINIYDIETKDKKWEMQLTSSGGCGNMAIVAPILIESALASFPTSASGVVESELPVEC